MYKKLTATRGGSLLFIGHSLTDKKIIREIIDFAGNKIYFIGIGGVSMSALAELSLALGLRVFGSDRQKNSLTEKLEKRGAIINYAHAKTEICRIMPTLVVYSLAIDSKNPEYISAIELGIPTVSRAEYMGALIGKYEKSVGVCGSHGKSTVTAMLYEIFKEAKISPTVIGGAALNNASSFVEGEGAALIYEACEYGNSFLHFSPFVTVMLNLDFDHTDYFRDIDELKKSFAAAAELAGEFAVINADDKNLCSAIKAANGRTITFSEKDGADFKYIKKSLGRGSYEFSLYKKGSFIGKFSPGTKGEFNVTNAVAAAVTALSLGVSREAAANALAGFRGIARRMELLGKYNNADVFYDYAHHPKEIAATRDALIDMGYNNICVIFAPHTYTRTKSFFSEFAKVLSSFSAIYIKDIYGARENPIVGISSSSLAAAVRDAGGEAEAIYSEDIRELVSKRNFDCLVLMGAGDLENTRKQIIST